MARVAGIPPLVLVGHYRIVSGSPVQRFRRTWLTRTWVAVFGVFPLVTGVYGAVHTIGVNWAFGLWVAWAAVGLAAGVRSALVAVVATPDELVIRNFFTTRRISWPEVRAIDRPRPWVNAGRYSGFYNRGNGLHVRLSDGRTRIAGAYTPAGWDPPGFADDAIEDLRRYANRAKRRH